MNVDYCGITKMNERQEGGDKSEKQNRRNKTGHDTIAYGLDSGSWGLAPTRACRYTTADKPLLGVWGYEIFYGTAKCFRSC